MKRNLLVLIGLLVAIAAVIFAVADRTGFLAGIDFGSPAGEPRGNLTMQSASQEEGTLQTQTQETLSPELMDLQGKNEKRLVSGCLAGKDCVPSIDNPKFVYAGKYADMKEGEEVLGIYYKGEARAYPLKIMNYHEVVNDRIGGKEIVVTYCPLSGSAAVFEGGDRGGDSGPAGGFGVSGMLLNNNLVLYDRKTASLWSQMTGVALAGPQTGLSLIEVPSQIMTYAEWLKTYPKTKVLSSNTGFKRDYVVYPYGDYRENPVVYYSLEHEDNRLPAKTVIFGILAYDKAKAYPIGEVLKMLPEEGEFEDTLGDQKIIVRHVDGFFSVSDADTKKELPVKQSFWFAWAAFYPQTEVFIAEKK